MDLVIIYMISGTYTSACISKLRDKLAHLHTAATSITTCWSMAVCLIEETLPHCSSHLNSYHDMPCSTEAIQSVPNCITQWLNLHAVSLPGLRCRTGCWRVGRLF